jgi:hypothetical protein
MEQMHKDPTSCFFFKAVNGISTYSLNSNPDLDLGFLVNLDPSPRSVGSVTKN